MKSGVLFMQILLTVLRRKPLASFACLSLLLTIALYWKALFAPFVYDDNISVETNTRLSSLAGALQYFWESIPFSSGFSSQQGAFYRPVFWLSLYLNRQIFGPDAFGFHLVNLSLQWLNAVFFFVALRKIDVMPGRAALASIFWLVLAVNSEAVAWISARSYLLCAAFLLLSFLFGNLYLQSRRAWLFIAFLFSAACSLFTHETGLLGFVLILGIRFAQARKMNQTFVELLIGAAVVLCCRVAGGVITGQKVTSLTGDLYAIGTNFWKYVSWIVFPLHQSIERASDAAANLPTPGNLLSWFLLIVLVATCYYLWRKRGTTSAASLLFMIAAILPVCGVVPIYQGLAERYMYGASFFFTFAVVSLFDSVRRPLRVGLIFGIGVLGLWNVTRTWTRLSDWQSEQRLYSSSLAATPNSYVLAFNLGMVSLDKHDDREAARYFQRALEINGKYSPALLNYGNLLRRQHDFTRSIKLYTIGLQSGQDKAEFLQNIGTIKLETGDAIAAQSYFQQALSYKPNSPEILVNLGVAYESAGNTTDAIQNYELAIRSKPDYLPAYNNLASSFLKLGSPEAAETTLLAALRHAPQSVMLLLDLAAVYRKKNQPQLESTIYQRVLEIDPTNERAKQESKRLKTVN